MIRIKNLGVYNNHLQAVNPRGPIEPIELNRGFHLGHVGSVA